MASGDLWGGAEAMLLELARTQIELGETVHVALLNDGLLAQRLAADRVPVQVFPETDLGSLALLRCLRECCVALRPDVVHTHRMKENVLGALAARSTGVPVCVRTAHGDSEHTLRWFQLPKQAARLTDRICVYALHDATVAVSEELAAKLRRRWMHGAIEVVQNGVDPDRIRRTATTCPPSLPNEPVSIRVCFVGRLVPVKRVDLFLAACSLLAKTTGQPIHAFVIGDGPLRAELETLARSLPNLRVTFTGFVNNAAAWLRKMDLMAITSDHEGLPVCLLEAIAVGTKVVSRTIGGIPEALSDSRLGRLVPTDRPDGVASAMAAELEICRAADRDAPGSRFPPGLTAVTMAKRYRDVYELAASRCRMGTKGRC